MVRSKAKKPRIAVAIIRKWIELVLAQHMATIQLGEWCIRTDRIVAIRLLGADRYSAFFSIDVLLTNGLLLRFSRAKDAETWSYIGATGDPKLV